MGVSVNMIAEDSCIELLSLCQEAILAARRRRDQLRAQNEELEANIRNTVRELNTRRLGGGA